MLGFVVLFKKQKVPHINFMDLKLFQANFKMSAVAGRSEKEKIHNFAKIKVRSRNDGSKHIIIQYPIQWG